MKTALSFIILTAAVLQAQEFNFDTYPTAGTQITAPLIPNAAIPTHSANQGHGGLHVSLNPTNIPNYLRTAGMVAVNPVTYEAHILDLENNWLPWVTPAQYSVNTNLIYRVEALEERPVVDTNLTVRVETIETRLDSGTNTLYSSTNAVARWIILTNGVALEVWSGAVTNWVRQAEFTEP